MANVSPLITIITAVFNGAQSLEKCIFSVICQTYSNIEYIIIDGGSTDGSIEIIKKYEARIAYWVSERDRGIYDALNKGLQKASGDWVLVLGCDDVLVDSLHLVAPHLVSQDEIYYGDVYLPSQHKIYDGKFYAYKLMYFNISHQSIFYPRKYYSKHQYSLNYQLAADHVYLLNAYGNKEFKLTYFPILIALYNDVSGKSSLIEDVVFRKCQKELIKNNFSFWMYSAFVLRPLMISILKLLRVKFILKKIVYRWIRI